MKFNDQVKKAKEEKLKYRITRDIIFIALGLIFFVISIIIQYNKDNKIKENNKKAYNNIIINII